ncbi:MAG: 50S ribosomal protein L23 [Pseudomonadota bacterium]|nr:50S ribosomal protein L23 [Pseudomonadota bacterium]
MSTAAHTTAATTPANAKPKHGADRLAQVLIAPIVSEKATLVSEKHNQVLFKVMRDATKSEIKAAVELMFKDQNVEVLAVSTVTQKGKVKRFGKSIGRRDHVKKAYVSLKKGQELNFSGEGA